MTIQRAALALAALCALAALPAPAEAGLGKSLLRGAAIGAGAAVGHKAANAALDAYSEKKRKDEAAERAAKGLPPAAAGAAGTPIAGAPATLPVPSGPQSAAKAR